jgi:hypothetical protein
MENQSKIIVAFHIGRGGRFHNAGHKTYLGEKEICEFLDDLHTEFENQSDFKNRYGWDSTNDPDQRCILDLLTDEDFDELEEKFGISKEMLGEKMYCTSAGNYTGLSQKDVDSGVGTLNIDNEYDTTVSMYIEDCSEDELFLIKQSNEFKSYELQEYLANN